MRFFQTNSIELFVATISVRLVGAKLPRAHLAAGRPGQADLKFVKKITRPNFRVKEFYTLKTCKSRLFSPAINSENASLSVI